MSSDSIQATAPANYADTAKVEASGVVLRSGEKEVIGYFIVGNAMMQFKMETTTKATLFLVPVKLKYRTKADLKDERDLTIDLTSTSIKGTFDNGPFFEGKVDNPSVTEKVNIKGVATWDEL